MKRRKRILVILSVLLIALIVIWNVFGSQMIGAFALQSEKIGFYELSVMLNCRYNPEKDLSLTIGNEEYIIPLPKNSARFDNSVYPAKDEGNQYLTSAKDLEDYFKLLSDEGWLLNDQMGAAYIFRNQKTDAKFLIIINKFTRYYYRLNFN